MLLILTQSDLPPLRIAVFTSLSVCLSLSRALFLSLICSPPLTVTHATQFAAAGCVVNTRPRERFTRHLRGPRYCLALHMRMKQAEDIEDRTSKKIHRMPQSWHSLAFIPSGPTYQRGACLLNVHTNTHTHTHTHTHTYTSVEYVSKHHSNRGNPLDV